NEAKSDTIWGAPSTWKFDDAGVLSVAGAAMLRKIPNGLLALSVKKWGQSTFLEKKPVETRNGRLAEKCTLTPFIIQRSLKT
ncbi:MAG: hypothetical protein KJP16_12350, partial [Gammaproteobacteria bacterium]|nr:hypothetical protein [Gammaproteobacteria bacterium]